MFSQNPAGRNNLPPDDPRRGNRDPMGRQQTTGVRPARDGDIGQHTRQVANEAQQRTRQVTEQTQERAREIVSQAEETARSTISGQKHRAAESLHTVAGALRQTGERLRKEDQAGIAHYATQAADQIEKFSDNLDRMTVDEMVDSVERFARERPEIFLGGALLLGLFAARFLKSSSQGTQAQGSEQRRGYGQQHSARRPATDEQLRGEDQRGSYPV
ncbi:MAG TPA: hypothetical protein GX702_03195 [Chloroflexi bacterium]|jgi:hypothetical protein|nr:hypothetical protein [Chloroflexota bacterium]